MDEASGAPTATGTVEVVVPTPSVPKCRSFPQQLTRPLAPIPHHDSSHRASRVVFSATGATLGFTLAAAADDADLCTTGFATSRGPPHAAIHETAPSTATERDVSTRAI